MLIPTREEGQRIFIGDKITVTLVYARNGKARIGIDAPPTVPIRLGEVERWGEGKPDEATAK